MSLDELDREILRMLHDDGRLPYSVIARQLNSNEATIRKRVQRLINERILEIIGVANPYLLGLETHVMIGIEVELRQLDAVAECLSNFPELNFVAVSSGEFDIVVVGVFASELDFYEFLTHKLAQVDGIRATRTSHLLRLMRRTFNYQIPDKSHKVPDDPITFTDGNGRVDGEDDKS
jgi:Lrp/AsnC family transcriptional regulator for asnA, asnC and gidA